MPAPVIHGLVMARNEWPLLEVSVTHALVHHVDRVHVLDHGSTDGTAAGLARMRREWGDRITVIQLGECPYLQEAAMCVLREIVAPAPDDWLYVFDGDEFGLTGEGHDLRDILAGIAPRHAAVRYEIHNWVAPADFSAADLDRYAELRHRSAPPVFLPVPWDILVDEIIAGTVNYFDVVFHSKVLVRGSAAGWTAAGCHGVSGTAGIDECRLPPDSFRVAHFPLLERRRLEDRVIQGRFYVANGFPAGHGWQSQMLARVAARGELDAFWARHSLDSGRGHADPAGPIAIPDAALAPSLALTLDRVRAARHGTAFGQDPTRSVAMPATAETIVPAALSVIRRLQATIDEARQRPDAEEAADIRRQPEESPVSAPEIPPDVTPAAESRPPWRRRFDAIARFFNRRPSAPEPQAAALRIVPPGNADRRPDVLPWSDACPPPRPSVRPAA